MSRVIALSVAKPRWENVRGSQVLTSIVRSPSPDPIFFGTDGPPDNATAVHTAPVLAFTASHYDHWAEKLDLPRHRWDWCHWGENITLTDIDENDLRVGDVLEIGSEARLEVTSPRNPCFKLAWRLNQPDAILKPMIESGFVGFYLAVLTPGLIRPGDPIRIHRTDPSAVTVGDLARMLAGIGTLELERMREILALPALGDQARGMLGRRATAAEDSARLAIGRWKGWRPFTVRETVDEADGIRSFHLEPVDGEAIAPFRAGQFVTVQLPAGGGDRAPSRVWSLSDYEELPNDYRVTIKRADPGVGSGWMHDFARAGQRVLLRPPAGRFTLNRGGFERAVMISAGIGITPMLAMLKAHVARGEQAPPLIWIHVTANGRTHVRAQEVDVMLREQGYQRHIFYTNPDAQDVQGRDHDEVGRPSSTWLKEILGPKYLIRPFGRDIAMESAHSDFYICGPRAFEVAVRTTLVDLGVADGHIHSESFGIAAGTSPGAAVEAATVAFVDSGVTVDWTADEDLTLLELAEAQGLEPKNSCRMGMCGTCEVALLDGEIAYDPSPIVKPASGRVLSCCARPASKAIRIGL